VPEGYWPIFLFLIVSLLFPTATLIALRLIRPSKPGPVKFDPYECGIPPESSARGRYSVRFYVIAILFVIFDVETIFLYPWAVRYKQLGWFGAAEAGVFLAILVLGYAWAYKRGAFEWV
jgi:NADH-quinone oxidoreductase subunit A